MSLVAPELLHHDMHTLTFYYSKLSGYLEDYREWIRQLRDHAKTLLVNGTYDKDAAEHALERLNFLSISMCDLCIIIFNILLVSMVLC